MEISLPDGLLISLQKKNISLTIYIDFRLRGLQTLAAIELINKEEMKFCGEVHLALSEDLPVPLWKPDESASLSMY